MNYLEYFQLAIAYSVSINAIVVTICYGRILRLKKRYFSGS